MLCTLPGVGSLAGQLDTHQEVNGGTVALHLHGLPRGSTGTGAQRRAPELCLQEPLCRCWGPVHREPRTVARRIPPGLQRFLGWLALWPVAASSPAGQG